MIALAILCPPLYFICVKKWGMAVVTVIMFLIALPLALFIMPPLVLWAIASIMALYHLKQQRMALMLDQHAERIGRSVASNMSTGKV